MDEVSPQVVRSPGLSRMLAERAAKKWVKKAAKSAVSSPIGIIMFIVMAVFVVLLLLALVILPMMILNMGDSRYSFITGAPISRFGEAEIPVDFIPIYQEAEAQYGVPWNLLAAIHQVETSFSQNVAVSSSGAVGHTQFMEKTWIGWSYPGGTELGDLNISDSVLTDPAMIEQYEGYGVDADGDGKADPFNLKDAIYSTANYLRANGAAEGRYKEAVFAYNHSQEYVDKVLGLADRYVIHAAVDVKVIEGAAWPVPVGMIVTSGFGERWGKHHKGVDIAASGDSTGKSIVALAPGVVEYSGFRGSYGYTVIIDHGNGLKTLYAHMMDKGIEQGSQVEAGTLIGSVGNTGNSHGAHLHFEVWLDDVPVDPMKYIQKFNPTLQDGDHE